MISSVLDRVIPEDTNSLHGGRVPWLPEFVPQIGLELIKNEFLSFSRTNAVEHGKDPAQAGSFVEYLCRLTGQGECATAIASVQWYGGGQNTSRESLILADGMITSSVFEFQSVLTTFMKLIVPEWQWVQSIEMFGRGGPAPGVGLAWGATGGGFWSQNFLLAQTDAELLISLLEVFQIAAAKDLPTGDDMNFIMQRINSTLGVCLTTGPREGFIMDKALDILLQVPVLKYFDLCIRHFISHNKGFNHLGGNTRKRTTSILVRFWLFISETDG